MLVRPQRLLESFTLARVEWLAASQQAGLLEDSSDARRTCGDAVEIVHHPGQPPIALGQVIVMKRNDRGLLPGQQPAILGHAGVVAVVEAEPGASGVLFVCLEPDCSEDLADWGFGPIGPISNESDDFVANDKGNPGAARAPQVLILT